MEFTRVHQSPDCDILVTVTYWTLEYSDIFSVNISSYDNALIH